MPTPDRLAAALSSARDFRSFAEGLLRGALDWPVPDEAGGPFEVGYEWSPDEVGTDRTSHKAQAFELMLLPRAQQPHGIFLLEFHDQRVFDTRGFATPLRAVLRRLVAGQRKEAHIPSWKLDNILFICTHDYTQYVFAMFRDTFRTGKVNEARLATFGWNRGEPCRTVVEHNLPHLAWPRDPDDREAWVKSWAEAFDKEPLTDRFFKHFDDALSAVKADLVKHGKLESAKAYSKAQLLLERLIFLYFVQNRGWLDQKRDFLRAGFAPFRSKPDGFGYYEQFLEPLFWSLSSAGHTSFSRNAAVPFLNGGLFNDDEFEPSPRRRVENPPLRVRNATFEKVFDEFLDVYNFTVREDTPLNQEVAVDPEMLGKVFESIVLQAEQSDPGATAPDKRKQTGSYYTPRIVVHFICREVLFQYLKPRLGSSPSPLKGEGKGEGESWPRRLRQLLELDTSDGLDREELETLRQILTPAEGARLFELVRSLRCCDPAVGSGAFMVGLLHELTNLRRLALAAANGYVDPARSEGSGWLHETKADIIENCLFGADIQQQAIEICMLRLWLSLVVDYDLGMDPFEASPARFKTKLKEISQLPNLEMNFKRGDSLYDHICGVPVVIVPHGQYRDLYREIGQLGRILHTCRRAAKKCEYRMKILRKRIELARRVIADTLKDINRELDSEVVGMFGVAGSKAERKRQLDHQTSLLSDALDRLATTRKELDELESRPVDTLLPLKLRKLEGADFDSDFNFAWRIDFPQVFAASAVSPLREEGRSEGGVRHSAFDTRTSSGGFDIIVGNPPFVTARNKDKRELYRERWQPYCYMKYHLLVPFFPLSFGILRPGGQLGFIVSNAFAKREFGKPLVEQFFTKVDLQKVVDCSGLMFPGHGTPTCLLFGANTKPDPKVPIRIAALLPGGGDLRTPPEESKVWHTLEQQHESRGYRDAGLVVADVSRTASAKWPWSFDTSNSVLRDALERSRSAIGEQVSSIGICFFTNADEVFLMSGEFARRVGLPVAYLVPCHMGDEIRNWSGAPEKLVLKPYTSDWTPLNLTAHPHLNRYLVCFRKPLGSRATFEGPTYDEAGQLWYGYHIINYEKIKDPDLLSFSFIATHNHFLYRQSECLYKQTSPIVKLPSAARQRDFHELCALLNSSSALFWLKQVCFSKRESEEAEKDTYYEFAGGKVEQLPVPEKVAQALKGEWNPLAKRLAELAEACWQRGQKLPSLAMKKIFEKSGEAYHEWNSSLPGYEKPHSAVGRPFTSAEEMRLAFERVVAEREKLRAEMIALQEEMDWLVYAAYGLLPEDHPAVNFVPSPAKAGEGKGEGLPEPLAREHRPYRLWQAANGDFANAISLIPTDRSDRSNRLWRARLEAIRDSEHIRRIEQPVYKRRWDEQWKVKNRWECGPVAYEAELADALEWWLLEKAEWYLEHKKDGGPVELSDWAATLWKDSRVRAAVEVVAAPSANPEGFERLLKEVVDSETVPAGIPFAKPWEELKKKKLDGLPKTRRIRGKLNVPRERFHLVSRSTYKWAGLLFLSRE